MGTKGVFPAMPGQRHRTANCLSLMETANFLNGKDFSFSFVYLYQLPGSLVKSLTLCCWAT